MMGSVKSTHPLSCWWEKFVKDEKRVRDMDRSDGIYYKIKVTKDDVTHYDYGKR